MTNPNDPSSERAANLDALYRRLKETFAATVRVSDAPLDELKDAVCAVVRELRKARMPSELVILQVEAALGLARKSINDVDRARYERVIAWCVDEYFAPDKE